MDIFKLYVARFGRIFRSKSYFLLQPFYKRDNWQPFCICLASNFLGEKAASLPVADIPLVTLVGAIAFEQAVRFRQSKAVAQERLGISPSQKIVVAPERLVKKAAKSTQHSTCDFVARRNHVSGEYCTILGLF